MALFQIFRGKASTLASKKPNTVEGYCYFTDDDGKFYIDTATGTGTSKRVVLNAGKADTAGTFTSAKSVTLTGDVRGTASSKAGWSITTTLADSGVTAGSYGPSKNVSPAHGGTFSVPYVTFDAKGRATAASTKTITLPTYTIGNATITIKAGTGLKTGGSFTTNQTSDGTITLNHSNSITAGSVGTAQSPSHGGTFAIPKITYDAQGHITAATTVNITLPADNNTLNTAGSSNTSSKIFLVGATSQASSATTYSHDTAYVGTDGHLYSNSQKVLNATNYSDYAVPLIEGSTSGSYTVYRALGNLYKGSEAVTYYRIALPQAQATSWGMIMMKLVIRENYSGGSTGEIIIYANHSSTAEWNTFYASCIGNLSTNIKVYGSDKKYLYIKGDFSYAGLSVELMTVGDSAANINLSNITIDTVTALPKTYQTATMLYSLHSGNYTSYTVTKTGSGASGTWGISISGTAAAAPWSGITGKPSYYDPKAIKSITRSGTTFTATHLDGTTSTFTQQDNNNTYTLAGLGGIGSISFAGTALTVSGTSASITQANARKALGLGSNAYTSTAYLPLTGGTLTGNLSGTNATFSGTVTGNKVYGAVWNDYAEYRWVLKDKATDKMPEPGRCVVENGNDSMSISNGRLQPGAKIISDTYGMCMGETEKAKTPIAVCGRVLAHPFERKIAFNVGDAVCSGPNGTVSRMTREEIMMYPERIVGTVVSKPTYKEWGPNKIPVNGRIWIQVK